MHGQLAAAGEGELVVGIRPEDFKLNGDAAAQGLQAQLDVIEPVGNEVFVQLRAGGIEIVVRTPPRDLPEPGSAVTLGFAPTALHFFDAGTERRLVG